ncbi:MAG: DMT family transporter [Sphaerochaetaceae bacterium]|nr:DMT family transporter [Sphaerochaetaceae bacterium]
MKEYKAIGLLLLTSLIWGFAFVAQSQAGDYVSPYTYNGIRMILGFMTLLPALVGPLKKHKGDKNYYCKVLEGGLICGAILGAASTFQQFGIVATSAGKSGFITSLYVLFVPFLSVFLKKKVSVRTWICVFFGLCGAFFLSISGESGITYGDILVFICAVLFAVHIMFIDYYNFFIEGVVLSATQFLFAGLLNFIVGFIVRDVSFTGIEGAAVSIIYGVLGRD